MRRHVPSPSRQQQQPDPSEEVVEFNDGSRVIAKHRCPAFKRLARGGFTLRYRLERHWKCCEGRLHVEALRGQRVVGRAEFVDEGLGAYCMRVEVERAFRRRGVATAMYVFAEQVLDTYLFDYWGGSDQSAAAAALWAQPDRPFGFRADKHG